MEPLFASQGQWAISKNDRSAWRTFSTGGGGRASGRRLINDLPVSGAMLDLVAVPAEARSVRRLARRDGSDLRSSATRIQFFPRYVRKGGVAAANSCAFRDRSRCVCLSEGKRT